MIDVQLIQHLASLGEIAMNQIDLNRSIGQPLPGEVEIAGIDIEPDVSAARCQVWDDGGCMPTTTDGAVEHDHARPGSKELENGGNKHRQMAGSEGGWGSVSHAGIVGQPLPFGGRAATLPA